MKTIVVTGSSRGIGRAICQQILHHPKVQNTPLTLYATSRAGKDLGLATAPDQKVIYPKLDISSTDSIATLRSTLQKSSVDVLINNGGVNLDNSFSLDNARTTIDVNYRGTLALTTALLPLITGRVVTLSSVASSLKPFSADIARRLRIAQDLDDVDHLAEEYLEAVEARSAGEKGWPEMRSYAVSKALVNASTAVLAREYPDLLINCCCPGWVETDMGKLIGKPPKTVDEGARVPVKLALGDISESGRFWANNSVRSREDGKVQEW